MGTAKSTRRFIDLVVKYGLTLTENWSDIRVREHICTMIGHSDLSPVFRHVPDRHCASTILLFPEIACA